MRAAGAVLFLVVTLLAACSADEADEATPTTPPATVADPPSSLYDLEVGDCFSGLGRN